jgi:hypothetical protein
MVKLGSCILHKEHISKLALVLFLTALAPNCSFAASSSDSLALSCVEDFGCFLNFGELKNYNFGMLNDFDVEPLLSSKMHYILNWDYDLQ